MMHAACVLKPKLRTWRDTALGSSSVSIIHADCRNVEITQNLESFTSYNLQCMWHSAMRAQPTMTPTLYDSDKLITRL